MRESLINWFSVTLVAISLVGCSLALKNDPLNGSAWQLDTSDSIQVPSGRTPTIKFSDGRVRGNAGCNSYQGEYSISSDKIEFKQLAMTLMACPEPEGIMELEQSFFRSLSTSTRFQVGEGQLVLQAENGNTLIFRRTE